MDLLHHWSSNNQYLFEIAISHWIFSIFDDRAVQYEVISHMVVHHREREALYISFLNGLSSHHVFTIFAYSWSLYSQYLSALCVFGLLFETPVLFLNIRDFCVCFEKELGYPISPINKRQVVVMWTFTSIIWHATRTSFCMLWPISLVFWRSQLVTVPIVSRLVYHLLGIVFNYVNLIVPYSIFRRYILEDQEKLGIISKQTKHEKMIEYQLYSAEFDLTTQDPFSSPDSSSSSHNTNSIHDMESQMKKINGAAGGPSGGGIKADNQLLGMKDVQCHNTPEDAWIVIDKQIYDITSFMSRHPGGRDVLLECLGQDATKAFNVVGHSSKARKMLESMKVGQILNHSYSQSREMANPAHVLAGDFNKPHELGKLYYDMSDPIALSYVFPFISFFLTSALCRELIFASLKRFSTVSSSLKLNSTVDLSAALPSFTIDRMEVYEVETSFSALFSAAVVSIGIISFLAAIWCLFLNTFTSKLKYIYDFLPGWFAIGNSFKPSQLLTSLMSIKFHLTAILLLTTLSLEWMMFSCGIYSAQSKTIGLRAIRLSLFLTFAFELMIRKIFFYSPFTEVTSPFPHNLPLNLLYNHGSYGLVFTSIFLELFQLWNRSNELFATDLELFPLPTAAVVAGDSSNAKLEIYPELPILLGIIFLAAILKSFLSRALYWLQPSSSLTLPQQTIASDIFHSVLSTFLLTSFYGMVGSYFFGTNLFGSSSPELYSKPSVLDLFFSLRSSVSEESSILLLLLFTSLSLSLFLLSWVVLIKWSTCHFSTQVMTLLPAVMLSFFAPPIGSLWRTVCPILLLCALYCVSLEGQLTLTVSALHAERTKTPIACPPWVHCAKQFENLVRHVIAYTIHVVLTRRLVDLTSFIAPHTQVTPLLLLIPSSSLTDDLVRNIGLQCSQSWILVPIVTMEWLIKSVGNHRRNQECFNATSGLTSLHLTSSFSYSLCLFLSSCRSYIAGPSSTDFYATAGSTLKMMKSLVDDPEAGDKGFVSDIVAQFNLEESR
jgi:cytochrome b involved in lipid metabolism